MVESQPSKLFGCEFESRRPLLRCVAQLVERLVAQREGREFEPRLSHFAP